MCTLCNHESEAQLTLHQCQDGLQLTRLTKIAWTTIIMHLCKPVFQNHEFAICIFSVIYLVKTIYVCPENVPNCELKGIMPYVTECAVKR